MFKFFTKYYYLNFLLSIIILVTWNHLIDCELLFMNF